MSIKHRNNVHIHGNGGATIVFAHGFGCDQTVWRYITPAFADRFRIVTFDLVGNGGSDLGAYDPIKYGSLHGYADDLLEIIDDCAAGPVIFVGHSVSAMIGMLASIQAPDRFAVQVMVAPSPCFIDDGDYVGGFSRADIDELLETMEANYLGWSGAMAPAIMGAPDRPQLGAELADSFCRNDPDIAKRFARVTFLSDHRSDLGKSTRPALILQCSDDLIAPRAVGTYLHQHLANSRLQVIDNVGHCPHMSAPIASADAIKAFLAQTLR